MIGMAYLKDTKCKTCGGKYTILMYKDQETGKRYLDGMECANCLDRIVTSSEDYDTFVAEYGER